MVAKREAEELLMIEEADAWFEYLEVTRSQSENRYHEVEPWAWPGCRSACARSGRGARGSAQPPRRGELEAEARGLAERTCPAVGDRGL